jgi:cytidylate kinase
MNRAVAPLVPAADAVIVDTSTMSVDDVEAKVFALAKERFRQL